MEENTWAAQDKELNGDDGGPRAAPVKPGSGTWASLRPGVEPSAPGSLAFKGTLHEPSVPYTVHWVCRHDHRDFADAECCAVNHQKASGPEPGAVMQRASNLAPVELNLPQGQVLRVAAPKEASVAVRLAGHGLEVIVSAPHVIDPAKAQYTGNGESS